MLRFYDAASGAVTDLVPARRGQLRICACDPATTGPATVSQLRAALLADVIRRNAERLGWSVLSCRAAAADEPTAGWAALNVAPADFTPGPHEVAQMAVTVIGGLIESGHAHPVPDGSVRFGASESWLLWETGRDGDGWPSPWGPGRPSPSMASSAVALTCLGDRIDLRIRTSAERQHEAAETAAVTGRDAFRGWLQSGNAVFGDRSLAAEAVAEATLTEVTGRGIDPLAIRLAVLRVRYREPAELSIDLLAAAGEQVLRWRHLVADWADEPSRPISAEYWARFTAALDDDLDTPAALAVLSELADDPAVPAGARFETFAAADRMLALDLVSLVGRPR